MSGSVSLSMSATDDNTRTSQTHIWTKNLGISRYYKHHTRISYHLSFYHTRPPPV